MKLKTLEQFIEDAGHKVEVEITDLPKGVSYIIDGERFSSKDLWQSTHKKLVLRYTMQLNSKTSNAKLE
ncbi:hypothetical protein [Bacillus toyonensis]|uniref:hypothetical protein n=1 Tax=Bacillus toyonensis TaxID=155322 RepID=UPI000BEFA10C|nr:hypothetical protein [Bacillus toyonensis]PEI49959.1 hypothetical protein CN631_15955 [Bacillus toyonensis]